MEIWEGDKPTFWVVVVVVVVKVGVSDTLSVCPLPPPTHPPPPHLYLDWFSRAKKSLISQNSLGLFYHTFQKAMLVYQMTDQNVAQLRVIPQNGQRHSNNSYLSVFDHSFMHQYHKMVKHTQNELFECVWPFCDIGA